jgi:hypothetical protein
VLILLSSLLVLLHPFRGNINIDAANGLKKKLKKAGKGTLVAVEENLVDKVWGSDRPARPENPVFVLPERFTGPFPFICIGTDGRKAIPG